MTTAHEEAKGVTHMVCVLTSVQCSTEQEADTLAYRAWDKVS